ncbi:hypothetical protein KIN20_023243 [Parelaphostrongylus tenuis]|uniref:Uncharacterized protein n=1 Tax=Parelaphostrongylus tenuis TaxID=148309 RepID=A0AAD5NC28_PARTN|nr:hypothetical protein KIN20_023243 [Parelaphostrongylus tenuis]
MSVERPQGHEHGAVDGGGRTPDERWSPSGLAPGSSLIIREDVEAEPRSALGEVAGLSQDVALLSVPDNIFATR